MLVALAPALVAVPAAARDGAPTGSPAPAAAATIAVDARAMLMAEATVHDGDAELPARGLLALPGAERRTLSVLLPMDGVPLGQAYAGTSCSKRRASRGSTRPRSSGCRWKERRITADRAQWDWMRGWNYASTGARTALWCDLEVASPGCSGPWSAADA
jgi:hypothetical protein